MSQQFQDADLSHFFKLFANLLCAREEFPGKTSCVSQEDFTIWKQKGGRFRPVVVTQGQFCPQRCLARSGDIFGCHNGGEGCSWHLCWVEARGATEHPMRHSMVPAP